MTSTIIIQIGAEDMTPQTSTPLSNAASAKKKHSKKSMTRNGMKSGTMMMTGTTGTKWTTCA